MTRIAAISVQTAFAPRAAVRPAAPLAAARVEAREAVEAAAHAFRPQVQAFAGAVLSALIDAQARAGRHEDPRPTHGHDDDHGHKPPVIDPPPVVIPPVVQPPVVEPPPVVTPPPVPAPHPVVTDATAAAGRALAILGQSLVERDAIREEGAAFTVYAAQRAAFQAVNRNTVATALLQGAAGHGLYA